MLGFVLTLQSCSQWTEWAMGQLCGARRGTSSANPRLICTAFIRQVRGTARRRHAGSTLLTDIHHSVTHREI